MANTLTGMIRTLYEALDVVSRELVGFTPAVTRDSSAERAAVGQSVRVPLAEAGAVEDVVPGQLPADTGDTLVDGVDIIITKSRAAPIKWSGEEQRGVAHSGTLNDILRDQFTDAMRKLVNEMEVDMGTAVATKASQAYGTAGTTPFGTAEDLKDLAGLRKILEENGAPQTDLQFVGDSNAWFNLRGVQSNLWKVNEAGTEQMLREGILGRLQGFATRQSAGVASNTAGTGAAYVTAGAEPIGAGVAANPNSGFTGNPIALATGTGTILAGNTVVFANDVRQYIATPDMVGTDLTIGKPGIHQALAGGETVTLGASHVANAGFSRNAVVLANRAPALVEGGDSADDRMTIQDPVSGLVFEVSVYRQYRQVKYEVAMAWGVQVIKPEHCAVLLG